MSTFNDISCHLIHLGQEQNRFSIGFNATKCKQDVALLAPNEHAITLAPTGAGKGSRAIIPTLLSYTGNVVVIDPKGENYAVTAAARKAMGHDVVLLDPFKLFKLPSAVFNPLNTLQDGQWLLDDINSLATALVPHTAEHEPFWTLAARQMLYALLYVNHYEPLPLRNLQQINWLANLPQAKMCEKFTKVMRSTNSAEAEQLAMYATLAERTFSSIQVTLTTSLQWLNSRLLKGCLTGQSWSPLCLMGEKPTSVYLVFPPERLQSHAALLTCWLEAIIGCFARYGYTRKHNTRLIIDEAAQLGRFKSLVTAQTLMRGYGLGVWSFWQDVAQLKANYPDNWQTLLNNCRHVQVFGASKNGIEKQLSDAHIEYTNAVNPHYFDCEHLVKKASPNPFFSGDKLGLFQPIQAQLRSA